MHHRGDGRIAKEHDDLMDATRYALMMLRHAKVFRSKRSRRRAEFADGVDYDPFDPSGSERRKGEISDADFYGWG